MRCGKVIPLEGHHVVGLCPLPVGLAAVDGIFPVLMGQVHRLGVYAAPFSRPANHKIRIAEHSVVIRPQQPIIAVFPIEIQGNIHAGTSPAYRAVHNPHEPVLVCIGRNLGQSAAVPLPVVDVPDVLAGKGRVVHQIRGRVEENLAVAGPAHPLPGGTVGGKVCGITFQ